MQLASDPSIAKKIQKMRERVRWQHPQIIQQNIDQTRFVMDDGHAHDESFSFFVIGDSGTGHHRGDSPQRRVAMTMLAAKQESRFTLHTGDVMYLVGSSEQYAENFIEPYREWLVKGEASHQIAYDQMVFRHPILPVPGNHDYYNISLVLGLLSQATMPIRRLFQSQFDIDVGWHGSYTGDAYARAFLDYLKDIDPFRLRQHLEQHYSALTETGACLRYQPGQFTRLPNRYYTFRYGGIDFFALDSNTFNRPQPIPKDHTGEHQRSQLKIRRQILEEERFRLLEKFPAAMSPQSKESEESEYLDDVYAKIEQISEQIRDIDQQLESSSSSEIDVEQLSWLERSLINSWNDPQVRGRILYFHHPPYVTEASKWDQGQTLAIRTNLRHVLNAVRDAVQSSDRPLVNLVLNGHAHCLEHLQTFDTGHGDSHLNWIVCGGSGFSLRRQRSQGADLIEGEGSTSPSQVIAQSKLYVGRSGRGSKKRRPYSCLRIDVAAGDRPQLTINPLIVEQKQKQWRDYLLPPFTL